jgi:DNA-binding NtrC family response regulator
MQIAVLLADDQADVREVLALELEDHGFAVVEAENAAAALALFERGLRPDAIVTDLSMPGELDGLGLIEAARARWPRLPAVVMTGHRGDAALQRLEQAESDGPFALLRKPMLAETLVDQLRRVLARDQPVRCDASPPSALRRPPASKSQMTAGTEVPLQSHALEWSSPRER